MPPTDPAIRRAIAATLRPDWQAAIDKLVDARADLGRAWLADDVDLLSGNRTKILMAIARSDAVMALDQAIHDFREALGLPELSMSGEPS